MGIRQEIQKDQNAGLLRKSVVAFVFALILLWAYSVFRDSPGASKELEKKTFVAKIADLRNSVESDGKVFLSTELNLDFPVQWIVRAVLKKEGDEVKKGETIAELDPSYFDIAIEKAEIAVSLAQANYRLKARGASDSDVRIMQLGLDSDLASYESAVEQSRGDYELSKESSDAAKTSLANVRRQSEIASANAEIALSSALLDVEIASGSLATITFQESEKYANLRSRLVFETGQLISLMERHLFDADILLGVTDANRHLNDSYETYLSAKNSSLKNRAETEFVETNRTFLEFYPKWKAFRQGGTESDIQLEGLAQELKTAASAMNRSLSAVTEVLKATAPSQYFPQSSIDSTLASFEVALSSMKSETASYAMTAQSVSEAKTSMDAKVLAAQNALGVARKKASLAELALQKTQAEGENSIELAEQKVLQAEIAMKTSEAKMRATVSKESSNLDISKIELESRTSADFMELEPLRIAVTSAQKALDEAKKRREDAFLRSPVDGKIVRLVGAEGGSSWLLKEPFVTVVATDAFFVRAEIEEGDAVKVKPGQLVYVSFDAVEGLSLTWTVTYLNDKATLDPSGMVSYSANVLLSSHDPRIREGMSVTAQFVTREKTGVLAVPVSAVRTVDKKPAVTLKDGTVRSVTTGFTDAKMVEIVSGLSAGESVVY